MLSWDYGYGIHPGRELPTFRSRNTATDPVAICQKIDDPTDDLEITDVRVGVDCRRTLNACVLSVRQVGMYAASLLARAALEDTPVTGQTVREPYRCRRLFCSQHRIAAFDSVSRRHFDAHRETVIEWIEASEPISIRPTVTITSWKCSMHCWKKFVGLQCICQRDRTEISATEHICLDWFSWGQ